MKSETGMGDGHILFFDAPKPSFTFPFWDTLGKLKSVEWRAEDPEVSITARVPSMARVFSGRQHLIRLDGDCFETASQDRQTFSIRGTLQNFTSERAMHDAQEACSVELARCLTEELLEFAGRERHADATEPSLEDTPFFRIRIYTHIDLKNYVFHHTECVPYIELSPPAIIRKRCVGLQAISKELDNVTEEKLVAVQTELERRRFQPFFLRVNASGEDALTFDSFSLSVLKDEAKQGAVLCLFDFLGEESITLSSPSANIINALRLGNSDVCSLDVLIFRSGGAKTSTFLRLSFPAVTSTTAQEPTLGGWLPRQPPINLAAQMDPAVLAEEKSGLNLQLLRWRNVPSLQTQKLASSHVLLLGMGTLGCHVSVSLGSWGVRRFTLVDNGVVSYSNLFRQPLYTMEDAAKGKYKVDAAAEALRRMIPTARVAAQNMTIAMPGHHVETDACITELSSLVQNADLVFLLTDSRESRWLPTVLCTAHRKPVINVALGIHSYTVMRHGMDRGSDLENPSEAEDSLGCYFCDSDEPPTDTLSKRQLDQQCTVSRPGVGVIASALAVELCAQVFQTPEGFNCPHESITALGEAPHMIQGSVYTHSVSHTSCARNKHCPACSNNIRLAYEREGKDHFLYECVQNPMRIAQVAARGKPEATVSQSGIILLDNDNEWESYE